MCFLTCVDTRIGYPSKEKLSPSGSSCQNAEFTIKHDFKGGCNRCNDDGYMFSYCFMDEASRHAKLFKKNEDVTFSAAPVKTYVPVPAADFDARWSRTTEVVGQGTYKLVYVSMIS